MSAPRYLLDTNILVHFVRGSEVWTRVRDAYHLLTAEPRPLVSVVTVGELRSLAIQWKWAGRKLDQVEFALASFEAYDISAPELIRTYALIDADCEARGQPMGKNDVWIAATAAVTGARLLTTDRDFDRLYPHLIDRDWIDPNATSVP